MMKLSQAAARDVDRCPWLSKCLSEYFAPGQFVFDRSHLVAVKWRSGGEYCVMLFRVGDELWGADVAGYVTGDKIRYEVCNDALDFTEAEWRSVKIDPYCDGFTTKEDRE